MEGRYNAGLSRESTFLDTSPLSHCPPPNARTKDSEDEKFNSAFKLFSPASPSLRPAPSRPAGFRERGEKKITSVMSPVVQPPRVDGDDLPLIIVTRSIRFRECNEMFRERNGRKWKTRERARDHRHPASEIALVKFSTYAR